MKSQTGLLLYATHTHTDKFTLAFKWTPNGARKWSRISAAEPKSRLEASAGKHVGFDTFLTKGLESQHAARDENQFMRLLERTAKHFILPLEILCSLKFAFK